MNTVGIISVYGPGCVVQGKWFFFLMRKNTYVDIGNPLDGLQGQVAYWIPPWWIMSEAVSW